MVRGSRVCHEKCSSRPTALMVWFVGHGVLEERKYCLGKVDSLDALRVARGTCGEVVAPHIWNEVVAGVS